MSEQGTGDNEKQQGQSNAQKAVDMAKEQGKQAVQKMAKEGIKKGAAKVGGHAAAGAAGGGAATGVLAAILPYLLIALLVILVIMIIIGIVAFLLTMPGMMSDKLKEFGQSIGDGIRSIFMPDAAVINKDDIVELAQYINSMEYDLLGYGFVTPKNSDKIMLAETLDDEGYEREEFTYKIDDKEKTGVKYKKDRFLL